MLFSAQSIQNLVSSLIDEVVFRSEELKTVKNRATPSPISPTDVDAIFAGISAFPEIEQMWVFCCVLSLELLFGTVVPERLLILVPLQVQNDFTHFILSCTNRVFVTNKCKLQFTIHSHCVPSHSAHCRLLSFNVVTNLLHDIPRIEADIASVRKSRNPTKGRRVVASFQHQLICFVRFEALDGVITLLVELVIAHADAILGRVASFVNALHHLDSMRKGRRVFVDAV